ncbi:hypothetical protein FQN53_008409 [Emmonsiellopsis sp. PD_33]|nr:hypothetical protein FQN53_008409 [Emmonsiellopsis sp. PD_33]
MGKNANKITHVDLEDVQHEEVEGALMEDGHKALHPGDYRKFHERLYYENEIIPHVSGPPPRRVKLSDEQADGGEQITIQQGPIDQDALTGIDSRHQLG